MLFRRLESGERGEKMRPENKRMKEFLMANGFARVIPKYIATGSLKRCWRLYDKYQKWSLDIAKRLNDLGFMNFAGKPLDIYDGNGGMFSVFVRGHYELLEVGRDGGKK